MYRLFMIIPFLAVIAASAFTVVQTDWSGGPAEPGPVIEFGRAFSLGANIDWSTAGSITLSTEPSVCLVDSAFNGATSVAAADLDGDGDIDLAGAALDGDEIAWWENTDGYGYTWVKHTVAVDFDGASAVAAADVDGDGDMDLLSAAKTLYGSNDIAWWENIDGAGGAWTYHNISIQFDGAHDVCAADVDGDGDQDVVGAAIYIDNVAWWENQDGQGGDWSLHLVAIEFDGAWAVQAGDLDGDGDQDIAGCAYYGDRLAWFENSDGGGNTWEEHNVDSAFDGAYSVDLFDIDGDGDLDIIGAAAMQDDVTWFENRQGTFIGHVIDGNFDGAVSVSSADMDGDGDGDVLAASIYGDEIRLWLNEDAWVPVTLAAGFDGAIAVIAADMDGDGEMDAAGAALTADEIAWFDRSPGVGYLESSILYTQTDPIWGILDWSAEIPQGTAVAFQVRASDDPEEMGDWSDPLFLPSSLTGILADGDSFVQYRALLQGDASGSGSPVLQQVDITWVPTAVGEAAAPVLSDLYELMIQPNPALSSPVIMLQLGSGSPVRVSVFDLSGRVVWEEEGVFLEAGTHQFLPGELNSGVYLCRVTAGSCTVTTRFAVVD